MAVKLCLAVFSLVLAGHFTQGEVLWSLWSCVKTLKLFFCIFISVRLMKPICLIVELLNLETCLKNLHFF